MLDKGWWWSGDWVQGFCLVRPNPTSRRGTPWLYYSWQDILPSEVQPENLLILVGVCYTERRCTKKLGRILLKVYWCHQM